MSIQIGGGGLGNTVEKWVCVNVYVILGILSVAFTLVARSCIRWPIK